jgi:transcriptional regulator with XRE-family HTH domain
VLGGNVEVVRVAQETLLEFVRARSRKLNMNMSALCRKSGISRQTVYALADVPAILPSMPTLMALAQALEVHPLRLMHLMFDQTSLATKAANQRRQGDESAFVRDVTFPDGELVLPHQRFVKTWEMQNIGQTVWEDRYLQCMDDEIVVYSKSGETLRLAHNLHPTVTRIAVPRTAPGDKVQLSVEFTAPEPPGTVLSYWKSVYEDGELCFPSARGLWVKVTVVRMLSTGYES